MTAELDLTLDAIAIHGWTAVLLAGMSKAPPLGRSWSMTKDVALVRHHVEAGGNNGLLCGEVSGVDVLDFDDLTVRDSLFETLGLLVEHVRSGSGQGGHCYVKHDGGLPAKIWHDGHIVGEIQRGPGLQQVVLPPSIHPGSPKKEIPPGGIYQWLVDPRDAIPTLPTRWRAHLIQSAPTQDAAPDSNWDGPPPNELLRRALEQPGARRKPNGVKFQCPGCRAEGHDAHKDNAVLRLDGRFGCAFSKSHRRAIGEALGVVVPDASSIAGYDSRILRRLGAFRL